MPMIPRRNASAPLAALLALLALALGPLGCATAETPDESDADTARDASVDAAPSADDTHNALTDAEREAGWRLLFDGETLAGWRGYRSTSPPPGWRAEDGTLHRFDSGGDIMTVDTFGAFELALEWRVEEGGNSGIFYLADAGSERIFHSAPEMQVLDDDGHPDGEDPLTSAGSAYAIYPAPRGVVRPAGQWNEARIVVDGRRVEHWLNGEKIVEYTLGSDDWKERVAASKFSDTPEYGTAERGHIGLQDHGDPVWFRNIKLRPLE